MRIKRNKISFGKWLLFKPFTIFRKKKKKKKKKKEKKSKKKEKETALSFSCLLFSNLSPFRKRTYSSRKEFARQEQFFLLRIELYISIEKNGYTILPGNVSFIPKNNVLESIVSPLCIFRYF